MSPEPLRSPHAAAPERSVEIARAVQAARLEFAFNGLPLALVVSVLLAGMTAVMLRGSAAAATLAAWFGCLTAVNTVRLVHSRHYRSRRLRAGEDLTTFDRRLFFGCLASGVVWGSSALLFFPNAPELQF